ncbi:MAG: DUF4279 domain-containing protein, partial [Acidobacteria bacterium]|nr:DUF4279 domain-containing protein [Acidobacteriota bacterium]
MDKVVVQLIVSSEYITPAEIEQKLGIKGDERREKGKRYGRARTEWKEHTWEICESREGDFAATACEAEINNCFASLMERVAGASPRIRSLAGVDHVWLRVSVQARSQPAFIIKPQYLRDIAELDAWLEYDVILYGDDDGERKSGPRGGSRGTGPRG